MIVLEGCDCAGKTTIAYQLAKRLIAVDKLRRFESYGLMPPWWDYSYMYVNSCKSWSVVDRFVVSEFVYGRLWRGGPNKLLDEENLRAVSDAMVGARALTVYVRPSIETVLKRMATRGEKLLRPQDVAAVYKMYDEYLDRDTCALTRTCVLRVHGEDLEFDTNVILLAYEMLQSLKE